MAWPKGRPRPEGAGRKKGTLNKDTIPVQALCNFHNCNPIEILIEFTKHPDPNFKYQAAKEIAQYIYPKRKALEVDANINVELAKKAEEYSNLPKEQQIELMEAELKRLKST